MNKLCEYVQSVLDKMDGSNWKLANITVILYLLILWNLQLEQWTMYMDMVLLCKIPWTHIVWWSNASNMSQPKCQICIFVTHSLCQNHRYKPTTLVPGSVLWIYMCSIIIFYFVHNFTCTWILSSQSRSS